MRYPVLTTVVPPGHYFRVATVNSLEVFTYAALPVALEIDA